MVSLVGTGLVYGYDYCVSIPNYKPTYSSYVNTIVPVTLNFDEGFNAMGSEEATATASASMGTESGSLASRVAAKSSTDASSSITAAPKPHMHKHKRAHDHGGGL